MKYQVLFSLKNNEKVFINVVCCSCDWRFKGCGQRITSLNLLGNSNSLYLREIQLKDKKQFCSQDCNLNGTFVSPAVCGNEAEAVRYYFAGVSTLSAV